MSKRDSKLQQLWAANIPYVPPMMRSCIDINWTMMDNMRARGVSPKELFRSSLIILRQATVICPRFTVEL